MMGSNINNKALKGDSISKLDGLKIEDVHSEFLDAFSLVMEHLYEEIKLYNVPQFFAEYLKKMLEYNLIGGKMIRGCLVMLTTGILKEGAIAEDDRLKAKILGWCVEILQGVFLVLDDIMDASTTRRGKLCWYKLEDVGLSSINDSIICNALLYNIVAKYFRSTPYYTNILELFFGVILCTGIGQGLDMAKAPEDSTDFSGFSEERYNYIIVHKTSYYSFYLPVALAMHISGITSEAVFEDIKGILVEIGKYFQIQDDYMDCYGDPEKTGKIGTDICDNKCSWLIVRALTMCSDAQGAILAENYGKMDPKCVKAVVDVYNELNMRDVYKAEEEARISHIHSLIDKFSHGHSLKKVLLLIVEIIHYRKV